MSDCAAAATATVEALACIAEWCAQEGDQHDDTCPKAAHPQTKGEFVEAAEISARHAIEVYAFMLAEGFTADEATDQAASEVEESAICFVGIGSCGRGWCKHS